MSLVIRVAVEAEADAIWRITREAYLPDRDRLHPPSGVFRETVDDVYRTMSEGTIYVALRGTILLGAARVHAAMHDPDALYCGRVAVAPSAQHQGIGTALMEQVECHARAAGYARIVLGVRLELPGNRRFYERLGYRAEREEAHPGSATPTYLWMRKEMSPPY